jgi:DNA-binding NarL/FixJ family response regulator
MPIRVLLLEDHTLSREALRVLLEFDGEFAVVAEAENGDVALELLEETHPDVVVTDIGHPGADGYEVIRRIRRQGRAVKVLVHTAYSTAEDITRCFALGAHGFVEKCEEPTVMVGALKALARGQRFTSPRADAALASALARAHRSD